MDSWGQASTSPEDQGMPRIVAKDVLAALGQLWLSDVLQTLEESRQRVTSLVKQMSHSGMMVLIPWRWLVQIV